LKLVYSARYEIDIGDHVFPTDKYRRIREYLLKEQLATEADFVEPPPPDLDDIRLVHTREFVDEMVHLRWTPRTVRSELPLTEDIVQGYFLHASGTVLGCQLALDEGKCVHLGGGFHHAFAEHAEGFCYVNDMAVGVAKMLKTGRVQRAAVLDCDLHQGNGTARIFQKDPRVFTFSIHQEALYPMKERGSLDIGLDNEVGDDEYLDRLGSAIPQILDQHRPELIVYQAGSDPYKFDRLGALRLTLEGLVRRDKLVYDHARQRNIPIVAVLGGGYALDTNDTVLIHSNLVRVFLEKLDDRR
jgi:acetoin utilization deacetylase AcuC-like enzyme